MSKPIYEIDPAVCSSCNHSLSDDNYQPKHKQMTGNGNDLEKGIVRLVKVCSQCKKEHEVFPDFDYSDMLLPNNQGTIDHNVTLQNQNKTFIIVRSSF